MSRKEIANSLGWHLKWWMIILVLTAINAVWTLAERVAAPKGPPVVFDRVVPLNSPHEPGENLISRIFREKKRDDCPVQSFRSATNEDGKVFDLPDRSWAGGPSNVDYIDVTYDTSDLTEGNYDLIVELAYGCPEQTYPIDQPIARFRVIKKHGNESHHETTP